MSTTTIPRGWAKGPAGVLRAVGTIGEPADDELEAYRYSAVPVDERVHPATCARPGVGRRAHARAGTPLCEECRRAENAYSRAARKRRGATAVKAGS